LDKINARQLTATAETTVINLVFIFIIFSFIDRFS